MNINITEQIHHYLADIANALIDRPKLLTPDNLVKILNNIRAVHRFILNPTDDYNYTNEKEK